MKQSQPEHYSFVRFLNAKKSVDDRSLNQHVWQSLEKALSTTKNRNGNLRILEIGSGTGTMLERVLARNLIQDAEYTGLDISIEHLEEAKKRIKSFASNGGFEITDSGDCLSLGKETHHLEITFTQADLFEFLREGQGRRSFDLLIAHAFLDLMDLPTTLPQLFTLLQVGGLFYFTGNYDGSIVFEPDLDPDTDRLVEACYRRSMDERITYGHIHGDRTAGRHLFPLLREVGGVLLDAGSSDWTVFANDKGYIEDEAYFLHFLVDTVEKTLQNEPGIDALKFKNWVEERHSQIRCGDLALVAHQLDFVGYWR
jgi:SAM-dependent methyltransferase